MGQNIHSMLPKQNFDKSIMSSRYPSIFCPYFWPIAWRAPQRIGGSILRRMSQLDCFGIPYSECRMCQSFLALVILTHDWQLELESRELARAIITSHSRGVPSKRANKTKIMVCCHCAL